MELSKELSDKRWRNIGLIVIILEAIVLFIVCVSLTWLPPPETDANEGLESHLSMLGWARMIEDPEVVDYVSRIGNNLVENLPVRNQYPEFKYTFRVNNYATVGANATKGGYVYISCGSLLEVRNEGELASLLAHEIAHNALRHQTRVDMSSSFEKIFFSDKDLIIEHEWEADIFAARILLKSGYDPNDFANILEREDALDPPEGGVYREHPPTVDRVFKIRQIAKRFKSKTSMENIMPLNRIKSLLGGCKDKNAK